MQFITDWAASSGVPNSEALIRPTISGATQMSPIRLIMVETSVAKVNARRMSWFLKPFGLAKLSPPPTARFLVSLDLPFIGLPERHSGPGVGRSAEGSVLSDS